MTLNVILAFDESALDAINAPADVIIFPELVNGGYAALRASGQSVDPRGPEVRSFRDMSRRLHATCVAGSLPLAGPRATRTNSSLAFHDGRLIHRYDKIHLFRPTGDDTFFRPGRSVGTFSFGNAAARLRAGVVICYDLRFPELVRFLARKGMDILFVPARWPAVRDDAWRTLLKARAIENQIFVVGCNARGSEGGESYVFGPGGEDLFTTRDTAVAAYHRIAIETGMIGEVRSKIRYIDDAWLLKRSGIPRGITMR